MYKNENDEDEQIYRTNFIKRDYLITIESFQLENIVTISLRKVLKVLKNERAESSKKNCKKKPIILRW